MSDPALMLFVRSLEAASANNHRFDFWKHQHHERLAREFAKSGARDEWHWLHIAFEGEWGLILPGGAPDV